MRDLGQEIYSAGTEKVINEQKLGKLVQQDNSFNMEDYAFILRLAAKEGPARLKKLLNLPGVDQTKPAYKRAAADTYAFIGANNQNPDAKILKLLLEKFKGDQPLKDKALSSIFKNVADYGLDYPSVEAAKILVANGADVTTAAAEDKEYFQSQRRSANQILANFRSFEAKILKP